MVYARGGWVTGDNRSYFSEAVAAADMADVSIVCLGLNPRVEGEEGDAAEAEAGGDRIRIDLLGLQEELLKEICALGKPVVLVLMNGSAVAINWAQENVAAIVEAWYPGEEGGTAVADVIFGDYNPAGRLPVTFYKSVEDLPPFEDYSMANRTYRYFEGEPLYPFGFGLSYTKFEYSNLKISSDKIRAGEEIIVEADITNIGEFAGDEVVQLYLVVPRDNIPQPIRKLVGFDRISLNVGEKKKIKFTIDEELMSSVDEDGKFHVQSGNYYFTLGGSQGDARSVSLGAGPVLEGEFNVCC